MFLLNQLNLKLIRLETHIYRTRNNKKSSNKKNEFSKSKRNNKVVSSKVTPNRENSSKIFIEEKKINLNVEPSEFNQNWLQLKFKEGSYRENKTKYKHNSYNKILKEERIHTETKESNIETIIRILWLMIYQTNTLTLFTNEIMKVL